MKLINNSVMAEINYDGRCPGIMIAVEDLSDYSKHALRYVCGYIHEKEIPALQAMIDECLKAIKEYKENTIFKDEK